MGRFFCRPSGRVPIVLTLLLSSAGALWAQPDVDWSRRNAIVRAIETAAPAVVSVNITERQTQRVIDPVERLFWEFFDHRPRVRVRERQQDAVGSGFIFDAKGHVLTNAHVIENAVGVSVTLSDGRQLEVKRIGVDKRTDLAVLEVGENGLPQLLLGDSDDLMTGEWVIAIGNPFGPLMGDAQPTVSVGVVSANHRRVNPNVGGGERLYQDMIQTDAAINPGNSGGPLVNALGEAVGVNTMIFSQSGGSIGLGFAIPANRAKRVADEILRFGRRRDPWPGFRVDDIQAIRPNIRRELGLQRSTGCIVVNLVSDSPAHKAGLRPGDVVLAINGGPVQVCADVDFAFWSLFVGEQATVDIERGDEKKTLRFPIEELSQ